MYRAGMAEQASFDYGLFKVLFFSRINEFYA
jgi:hypothetical protein